MRTKVGALLAVLTLGVVIPLGNRSDPVSLHSDPVSQPTHEPTPSATPSSEAPIPSAGPLVLYASTTGEHTDLFAVDVLSARTQAASSGKPGEPAYLGRLAGSHYLHVRFRGNAEVSAVQYDEHSVALLSRG